LQRLKEANKGLYLGPLRLLAAEVYETLTADGLYTNLFTGQERRHIAFSTHSSATVEMAAMGEEYDVVVIDEIQMISDVTRGAAWTKALLGLRCKEIHVCGGLEAKEIVQKIAKACGDDFELNTYERFSELKVAKTSLSSDPTKTGSYRNVQPGDCVVAFSRNDVFAIKREIEKTTGYKCCIIYGKLPPRIRADQARRFNDINSGYDILVASDAIGMGLNLNIKRIIFNSIFKFNGEGVARLSHSEIKQISGRAGRRNSPYPNGEVTCRDPRELPYIRECLNTQIETIEKAALLPTAAHIELFSEAIRAYEPGGEDAGTDLHQILRQFSAMATVKGDFFLGRQTEMRMIAKRLKHIPLPLRDAYTMCLSPTTENSLELLENYAWKLSREEISGLPSRKVPRKAKSFDDLSYLCGIYSDADLFIWLQYKFPPSNAVEHQAALSRKEKTLEFINEALANTEHLKLNHCYLKQATRHRSMWEAENGLMETDETTMLDDLYDNDEDEYSDDEENHA
jgi:ATP-dependent RNA helicase SUPV3L1/SUV3